MRVRDLRPTEKEIATLMLKRARVLSPSIPLKNPDNTQYSLI